MEFHKVSKQIEQLLKEGGFWYERFEHESVRTSEEAAKVRDGYTLAQGAKALIVRVKKRGQKYFVMIVIPGDERFNEQKVKKVLGAMDIRFASLDEVHAITSGVQPGGVPPFGNLFNLKVYADNKIFFNEKIIFNAGDKRVSIGMKVEDYNTLVQPEVVDILS